MILRKSIYDFVNKLVYPNKYSNEAYVRYLRRLGAQIGENTRFIAPKKCNIDEGRAKYISIGDNCCLSVATILAHDYSWYVFFESHGDIVPDSGGSVKIGNNVFIGYQACILKDTVIGDNVIIGARSVVKGNIPPNTVWAGVPARQICTLEELYEKRKEKEMESAFFRYNMVFSPEKSADDINVEMGFLSATYLERTEDNYIKYIMPLEFNGVKGRKDIKNWFMSTKPIFNGLDNFMSAVQMNEPKSTFLKENG